MLASMDANFRQSSHGFLDLDSVIFSGWYLIS